MNFLAQKNLPKSFEVICNPTGKPYTARLLEGDVVPVPRYRIGNAAMTYFTLSSNYSYVV